MNRPAEHYAAMFILLLSMVECPGALLHAQTGCVYVDSKQQPLYVPMNFQPVETKAAPIKIVALGDSVMWGNGERFPYKFVALVAQSIADKEGAPITVHIFAHSGALLKSNDDSAPLLPIADDGTPLADLDAERPTVQEQEVCASVGDKDAALVLWSARPFLYQL